MNDYKIAFYYSPDDEAYITCVPELPGCMSDGKTIEDAIGNTHEIINEWIETAEEFGDPVPKPLIPVSFSNARAVDVAKYILEKTGDISTWALEKLTYYCKVWSLVWYGKSITDERVEAWVNGPVFPNLYQQHKQQKIVSEKDIQNANPLTDDEKAIVGNVLMVYSYFTGEELRNMTHREKPWIEARGDLPNNAPSNSEITDQMIVDYYRQRETTP